MSQKKPHNLTKSIRDKLKLQAKQKGEDFNYVVIHYMLERFLYRLSQSDYKNEFILKGATLFRIWHSEIHRPTKDLDFLGSGTNEISALEKVIKRVCQEKSEDGIQFEPESVIGRKIKEGQQYEGVNITLNGNLDTIKHKITIDIGFGDTIFPEAVEVTIPTLLDLPAPSLKIYPRETVVAEKFQAMINLGISNSRMKDFYDIWLLAKNFKFEGNLLKQAFESTFKRRKTHLPNDIPFALTEEFIIEKKQQWQGFIKKGKYKFEKFDEVINEIKIFLIPPCLAAANGQEFEKLWLPEIGQWID